MANRLLIRPEVFGAGFDVLVEPSVEPTLDREFHTAIEARAYAAGVSAARGWPVCDETDDVD
ncbi:MAG: hypothetical protein ACTHMG_04845 [Sphingomonas sp.]